MESNICTSESLVDGDNISLNEATPATPHNIVPSTSQDAINRVADAVESDSRISSTTHEDVQLGECIVAIKQPSTGNDTDADYFSSELCISDVPVGKITENVEDIVQDLENLLGEPLNDTKVIESYNEINSSTEGNVVCQDVEHNSPAPVFNCDLGSENIDADESNNESILILIAKDAEKNNELIECSKIQVEEPEASNEGIECSTIQVEKPEASTEGIECSTIQVEKPEASTEGIECSTIQVEEPEASNEGIECSTIQVEGPEASTEGIECSTIQVEESEASNEGIECSTIQVEEPEASSEGIECSTIQVEEPEASNEGIECSTIQVEEPEASNELIECSTIQVEEPKASSEGIECSTIQVEEPKASSEGIECSTIQVEEPEASSEGIECSTIQVEEPEATNEVIECSTIQVEEPEASSEGIECSTIQVDEPEASNEGIECSTIQVEELEASSEGIECSTIQVDEPEASNEGIECSTIQVEELEASSEGIECSTIQVDEPEASNEGIECSTIQVEEPEASYEGIECSTIQVEEPGVSNEGIECSTIQVEEPEASNEGVYENHSDSQNSIFLYCDNAVEESISNESSLPKIETVSECRTFVEEYENDTNLETLQAVAAIEQISSMVMEEEPYAEDTTYDSIIPETPTQDENEISDLQIPSNETIEQIETDIQSPLENTVYDQSQMLESSSYQETTEPQSPVEHTNAIQSMEQVQYESLEFELQKNQLQPETSGFLPEIEQDTYFEKIDQVQVDTLLGPQVEEIDQVQVDTLQGAQVEEIDPVQIGTSEVDLQINQLVEVENIKQMQPEASEIQMEAQCLYVKEMDQVQIDTSEADLQKNQTFENIKQIQPESSEVELEVEQGAQFEEIDHLQVDSSELDFKVQDIQTQSETSEIQSEIERGTYVEELNQVQAELQKNQTVDVQDTEKIQSEMQLDLEQNIYAEEINKIEADISEEVGQDINEIQLETMDIQLETEQLTEVVNETFSQINTEAANSQLQAKDTIPIQKVQQMEPESSEIQLASEQSSNSDEPIHLQIETCESQSKQEQSTEAVNEMNQIQPGLPEFQAEVSHETVAQLSEVKPEDINQILSEYPASQSEYETNVDSSKLRSEVNQTHSELAESKLQMEYGQDAELSELQSEERNQIQPELPKSYSDIKHQTGIQLSGLKSEEINVRQPELFQSQSQMEYEADTEPLKLQSEELNLIQPRLSEFQLPMESEAGAEPSELQEVSQIQSELPDSQSEVEDQTDAQCSVLQSEEVNQMQPELFESQSLLEYEASAEPLEPQSEEVDQIEAKLPEPQSDIENLTDVQPLELKSEEAYQIQPELSEFQLQMEDEVDAEPLELQSGSDQIDNIVDVKVNESVNQSQVKLDIDIGQINQLLVETSDSLLPPEQTEELDVIPLGSCENLQDEDVPEKEYKQQIKSLVPEIAESCMEEAKDFPNSNINDAETSTSKDVSNNIQPHQTPTEVLKFLLQDSNSISNKSYKDFYRSIELKKQDNVSPDVKEQMDTPNETEENVIVEKTDLQINEGANIEIQKVKINEKDKGNENIKDKAPINIELPQPLMVEVEESSFEASKTTDAKPSHEDIKSLEVDSEDNVTYREPLKMTISKHKLLKIYDPNETNLNQEPEIPKLKIRNISLSTASTSEEMELQNKVTNKPSETSEILQDVLKVKPSSPKITIKPIIKPEPLSPIKLTIRPYPKLDDMQSHSPKSNIKADSFHSPKITIKPVLKSQEQSEGRSSPRITIKPLIKPPEENFKDELQTYSEGRCSPKITIKPILKSNEEFPDLVEERQSPRITIKPIVKPSDECIREEKHSPRITIKPVVRSEYSDEESFSGSPRITIKPIIKHESSNSNVTSSEEKASPRITIKPIMKVDEESTKGEFPAEGHSSKITIKSLMKPSEAETENVHSPRITIKPIIRKADDENIVSSSQPFKLNIKPVVKPPETNLGSSLTVRPITQSELEPPSMELIDFEEQIKQERIVLKIAKNTKRVTLENEKLKKIKLKLSKKRDLAHIVQSTSESVKRPLSDSGMQESKHFKANLPSDLTISMIPERLSTSDVTITRVSDTRSKSFGDSERMDNLSHTITPIPISSEHIKKQEVNSTDIPDPLADIPVFEITLASSTSNTKKTSADVPPGVPPAPRKRGRPRKVPLVVREEFKDIQEGEIPIPVVEESSRPKRSCRGRSIADTLGIKPRKPRAPSTRGRGRGRGSRGGVIGRPSKKTVGRPKASKDPILKEHLSFKDFDVKDGEFKQTSTDVANSEVVIYEEETRMSAENSSRAQTPAKQVLTAAAEGVEESQSSVQSNTTTESGEKVQKSRKGPRLEVHQEPEGEVISADKLAEYCWGGGGPYMLQEQVAQFLGIKSFKRKYPGIQRRTVDMQERDFIRESCLASEPMCDMGLTAVKSEDILDIMYTDFQHKYEEYCKHQRDRQAKDVSNKQKALSLAASQEKNKLDIVEQAVQSAFNWNANFNKARKEERRACMDLQTFTVHFPKGKIKQVNKQPVGNYPLSLVPGQYTDYYKKYSPFDLSNLPLNTTGCKAVCIDSTNQDTEDSQTDGSGSDSDSSSSDTDSSYSGSSEDCKMCSRNLPSSVHVKKLAVH